MTMRILLAVLRIATWLTLMGCAPAWAQYACNVTAAGAVNFGTYTPSSGTPALGSTSTTLTCSYVSGGAQKVDWSMTLSSGNSGNCNARTLTKPGDALNYNIYQNSIAGGVWGDLACATYPFGTMTVGPGGGNGTRSVTYTLYGQIPISQYVSAGSYNDFLTLTITY
jgi:spore coat protein U-like protein